MIARLPPNALVSPDDFMMPRTVNCLLAERRAERTLAARPARRFLLGEFLRQDDRIRLREKHQRIVDDRFVAALEVVVAQAAIAGHVDAEDQQVALARDASESTTASMTGTATRDGVDRLHLARARLRRSRSRLPSPAARSCRRCDRRCVMNAKSTL